MVLSNQVKLRKLLRISSKLSRQFLCDHHILCILTDSLKFLVNIPHSGGSKLNSSNHQNFYFIIIIFIFQQTKITFSKIGI